ncbi:MAG: PilZ domain-containing protein [Xanthomonadaceae bacterium]|nr:PilZ domain-containing protein [Xanthomonadaceae bacterium]
MSTANYKPIDNPAELKRIYREISRTKPSAHFQFTKIPDFHPCRVTYWSEEEGFFLVQYVGKEASEKISAMSSLAQFKGDQAFFNSFLLTSQILFKAQFVETDLKQGMKFSFPEKFYKIQRRKHTRVPLTEFVPAQAVLTLINPTDMQSLKITRRVIDLSMGGCAVRLEKDDAALVKKYNKLQMVNIQLGGLSLTNPGVIRNVTGTKIGIEMDLKNQIQQKKFAAFLLQQLRTILDDPTITDI